MREDKSVKTLGLWWSPKADSFNFVVKLQDQSKFTKRIMLAEISRLFDPLGLLGPVILKAKLFIQNMWKEKSGWDDEVTEEILADWVRYRNNLASLQGLNIPRKVITCGDSSIEVHGFCDASEMAYGAVIYIRSASMNGSIAVHLLCSKSRVAPLKKLSIPRLELCGALLLAKLMNKVKSAMVHIGTKYVLWSDSTIVLAWVNSPSRKWKTFVANRVAEIQIVAGEMEWRHVPTNNNPADILSRGLDADDIVNNKQWWHGPEWLSSEPNAWPSRNSDMPEPPEARCLVVVENSTQMVIDLMRFSSFAKLIRTLAYVTRFINNTNKKVKRFGRISQEEFNNSLRLIIVLVQREAFREDIRQLKNGTLKSTSRILSLCPFLDKDNVLRVGGRLAKAEIDFNQKHQILLPAKHRFTALLFEWEHKRNLHAGPQLLLSQIRQNYWPLGGRNLARKTVHDCVVCFKAKPRELIQQMGDLPAERIQACRPFLYCGVDYCGPISVKLGNRRGCKGVKAYIAVFVCFTTRAVHLELVSELTTAAFLGALKRFFARRGKAKCLFSDNGKNFVGANKELHRLFQLAVEDSKIYDYITVENIEWKFIPPRAPHFGGLWEAAVKSCKYHFKRVVGNSLFTYEELYTILTLIESCLNSRPLTSLTSDPNDLNPLTPGHFLIGETLNSNIEPDWTEKKSSLLSRWQRTQAAFQGFWKRWYKEYLSSLQVRAKWRKEGSNLQKNQLVVLKEDNVPPLNWKMGRVIDVHAGEDGLVRVATVKTASGVFRRAVAKLCPLPQGECIIPEVPSNQN